MDGEKLKAASEILEMLGCAAPHSNEECQKVLDYNASYFSENNISSIETVQIRAERNILGFFAGIQEIATETKINRK